MVNDRRRPPPRRKSSRSWRRRPLVLILIGLAVVVGAFGLFRSARAGQAALHGKGALLRAEQHLSARQLEPARAELVRAGADFERSRREIQGLARILPFARRIPLLGSQIRGVEDLSEAGVLLSAAGVRLADAASGIIEPADENQKLSDALDQLRGIQGLLRDGVATIDEATAKVDQLDGQRLVRPLGRARTDLSRRLPEFRDRATDAQDALASMITFAGGDGARRYLVLSQNPDEVRPTGGFIGTYGVLTAVDGKLSLDRYDGIETWITPRPDIVARPAERGSPLRFDTRLSQSLANVNTSPDWPQGAQLATRLWERGGEEPVQGVVSFTPAFLARILGVVGAVTLEEYGETITAANVIERLDYYTHIAPPEPGTDRKDFVAVLAQAVMSKLFDAPASQWDKLAQAFGAAFGNREAMAWSTDAEVGRVLADRGWDGSVPVTTGDFVYPAEFEYAAKHGRELRPRLRPPRRPPPRRVGPHHHDREDRQLLGSRPDAQPAGHPELHHHVRAGGGGVRPVVRPPRRGRAVGRRPPRVRLVPQRRPPHRGHGQGGVGRPGRRRPPARRHVGLLAAVDAPARPHRRRAQPQLRAAAGVVVGRDAPARPVPARHRCRGPMGPEGGFLTGVGRDDGAVAGRRRRLRAVMVDGTRPPRTRRPSAVHPSAGWATWSAGCRAGCAPGLPIGPGGASPTRSSPA